MLPRRLTLCVPLLALLWPACAAPVATPAPHAKSIEDQWIDLMVDEIGPAYETLRADAERAPRDIDFAKLAADARGLAAQFALGHGRLEVKTIPKFADHARWTEAWLREIATAAEARDHGRVRQLAPLDDENCEACHKAATRK